MSNAAAAAPEVTRSAAERWQEVADWATRNGTDILLAIAVATAIALLLFVLRRVGHRLIRDRDSTISWRTIFGRVLAKTSIFFIVMTAGKLVSSQADAPPILQRTIDILFTIAAAFQAAVWARELILGYIRHRVGEDESNRALGSAIGIIRLLVTVALFAIAIILILDNLGVNVTGLVAGLGIGGIAIGLAAQGIFSDLFAALSIIFDKPFRKGDTISFGSPPTTGIVEHIGLKSTRIRALGGEEVVMANTKLLEQQLQNWTLLQQRRVLMQFGVIYQTAPDLLARIPMELEEIVKAQPLAAFDRCHAFQFAASSIDFELVFHVESSDVVDFMATRQAIMLAMVRTFAELGVEFAYPTQTTFTAAPDGSYVMPYAQAQPSRHG
jgi:small-conductance mechanosensitive channel